MPESFTPDKELVMLFLRKYARSTAEKIATHSVLKRALDGLDAKGLLRHTDDSVERYYLIHVD